MSGYCSWCGEGNACCKRGFAGDPEECKRAVGFTSEHHECVRLLPESKQVGTIAGAAASKQVPEAPAGINRRGSFRAALLHEGEDCWGRCDGGNSGYCSWCGQGHACCKRGFDGDPLECQRAIGFTSEHHQCVRLMRMPAMLAQWVMPSWSAAVILAAAWAAACGGALLLLRPRSPVVKPKALEGEVDLQWRRRSRDDAALRKELTEKAKRLHWLGFHV
uniref:Uncharacterized protein n=1 Tax=Pyrodinium bahamense TaxID=73915 RepID=A0A7S0B069_9DINO